MNEFEQFLSNFLKRPILQDQEAQILTAVVEGKINIGTAKKLYLKTIDDNLQAHKEIMKMTEEELKVLCEKYGVEYDPS
jgi:FixJ family two-component response regulator